MSNARAYRLACIACLLLLAITGCRSRSRSSSSTSESAAAKALARLEALDVGNQKLRVGAPIVHGTLAVLPIFSSQQQDIGPVLSLQDALARGVAEVREVGGAEESDAVVSKLVIDNRGKVPVYVLGGSVVKGGKQDRQIGQDFVVAAKSSVPVDAFCVEHGRWDAQREGVATNGKFSPVGQLATSSVRAAGHYESDQQRVWSEVSKLNAANEKQALSGTLLASLDDEEIGQRRSALAKQVGEKLRAVEPSSLLVGFGYAIGGKVKSVRWFASHRLFETFRDLLVNTAAADAVTAEGGDSKLPPPSPAALARFVRDVEKEAEEERATPAENVNAYKRGKAGYGSTTELKASPRSAAVPVSKDYLAH